jgi:peptide chain release factor 1
MDPTAFLKKVTQLESRLEEIRQALQDPRNWSQAERMTRLSREQKTLSSMVDRGKQYRDLLDRIHEDEDVQASSSDAELKAIARQEMDEDLEKKNLLEQELKLLWLPKDVQDEKNAIMEIRPGTGGEEAALFAADLYKMYSRYIENRGWNREILQFNPTGLGGIKEITILVSGDSVYGRLKYESGVHRVQRVPQTETGGRIHTSAASVVVLPEAEEVDIDVDPKDLRIDVFRSSGPGGQSVNTTDSAVRITHLPTGLVVSCQDEKSQHKNKAKGMKVLRARLYDMKRSEEEAKIAADRRSIIGTGDRSAKIRTFNFPQGRVTDHRIGLTLYRLQEVLSGDLDELLDKLRMADAEEKMQADVKE